MEKEINKRDHLPVLFFLSVAMGLLGLISLSTMYADTVSTFLRKCAVLPHFQLIILSLLVVMGVLFGVFYRHYRRLKAEQNEMVKIISKIDQNAKVVLDSENKIALCNEAIERMLGYNPEELENEDGRKRGDRDRHDDVPECADRRGAVDRRRVEEILGDPGHEVVYQVRRQR